MINQHFCPSVLCFPISVEPPFLSRQFPRLLPTSHFLSVLLLCCASHLLLPETHLPTRSPLSSAICVSLPLVSRKSSQIVDQRSCFSKFQTRNQANWKVIPKHNKVFFIGGAKKKTCEACMWESGILVTDSVWSSCIGRRPWFVYGVMMFLFRLLQPHVHDNFDFLHF
jgi:hypothetical protein